MSGIQNEDIQRLQAFIQGCKMNPKMIYLPELKFFREFIESFGGTLPDIPMSEPEPEMAEPEREKSPEPQPEPEPISSDESEVELDMEGTIEPETDPLPEMGDNSKVVSEEDEMAASEKRGEAMDIIGDDPNKAIEILTEAILLNPASAAMYAKRANVLLKQKRVNAALRDCCQAIELNHDYAPAYKFRGRANRLLGNWVVAAQDLRMACKLDYDEQADEWLKEVQVNANKLEEHTRRYERKRADKEMAKRQQKAEKARKANEEARKEKSDAFDGSAAPGFMKDLFEDEDLMKAFGDPEVGPALQDIMQNPANFAKYQNNPKIISIMNKLMSKGMAGGGPGGVPGGFPGGMPEGFPGGMPGGFPGGMSGGFPGATTDAPSSSGDNKATDDLD